MNTSKNSPILIEPLGKEDLEELAGLYFRRYSITYPI